MKLRLRLIRARPNFYMISDNPNVSLGTVDCSIYTRRFSPKDDDQMKRMDKLAYSPVQFNYFETLARTFINPARQNKFMIENILNNASARRIAVAKKMNSAFTGLLSGNLFWYQQFDLRQIRVFRGGQAIVAFDAADSSRYYVINLL